MFRGMRCFLAAALCAVPLLVSAGTWQPLTNQPPLPDITDPGNGTVLSPGGASFPVLLTDGTVLVRNVAAFYGDARVFKLTPTLTI